MGLRDKLSHKAKEATGKIKEKAGDATQDESLRAEGLKDQAAERLKEKAKDIRHK